MDQNLLWNPFSIWTAESWSSRSVSDGFLTLQGSSNAHTGIFAALKYLEFMFLLRKHTDQMSEYWSFDWFETSFETFGILIFHTAAVRQRCLICITEE